VDRSPRAREASLVIAMSSLPAPPKPDPGSPRKPADRAELTRQVSRLRVALQDAAKENAVLQRELAITRAENRRLRGQIGGVAAGRAREERRRMLSAPWSRNP
jgi:hypothetical protein